jgi:hypothetical protein
MRAHGRDRVRESGGRILLLSAISKGWTARVPKTLTTSEHPGTAVIWEDQYFEVIEAALQQSGGVRYVLAPWRDEHTIRTFERYDGESEAQRIADYRRAARQRKASVVSRLFGVVLGHLPEPVQARLQDDVGVVPSRMTILSCVPPMIWVGYSIWAAVDAKIKGTAPPFPPLVWVFIQFELLESLVRFFVAMSQGRGMGSAIGTLAYIIYWGLSPKREKLVSPFGGRGYSTASAMPVPEDVARADALEMKSPMLTLLTADEQQQLAERYGFDYRRHAYGTAWIILVFAILGAVTSILKMPDGGGVLTLLSIFVAGGVALEQILRLRTFPRGPAGSVLGALVRPFVKSLFTARN